MQDPGGHEAPACHRGTVDDCLPDIFVTKVGNADCIIEAMIPI